MKRTIFLLGVLGFALIVIGLPFDKSEAAPPIVIKAVSAWPLTHVGNDFYKRFINRVNEKAKGELEIQLIGGPEVIPPPNLLKAAADGVIDMLHGDPNNWAGIVPEGAILGLIKEKQEIKALRESGVYDLLTQAYLERGKVFFLGETWLVPFYIMTKKPVSKLEDIKGLKLRSLAGMMDVLLGELGASTVKISSAETYEGLQRGIVDGSLRNPVSLIEFKEYEVMKYIVTPAMATPPGCVFIGEGKWNTIPKNLQKMMSEVMMGVEVEALKYYYDMSNDRLKEAGEKHGMKMVHLSKEDAAKFYAIRTGAAPKEWYFKKAPQFGPPIYEKLSPYCK